MSLVCYWFAIIVSFAPSPLARSPSLLHLCMRRHAGDRPCLEPESAQTRYPRHAPHAQVFTGIRKTDLYNLTSDVNFENFGSALFYLVRFLSGA